MHWLARLCIDRPVFASVLSIVILVVGGVFYRSLGVDQFPKIEIPTIIVITTQPGASPEDIEREISDKLEGAINTVSGIEELRSVSSEGVSQVLVQFKLEKNVDVAVQEVQQKINATLAELPRGIDPPIVQKFDPDASPVLFLALRSSKVSGDRLAQLHETTDLADRVVRRRLESVLGVGQVSLIGGRKRQIQVRVDPLQLRALGVAPAQVAAAIGAQNVTLPGGRLDQSRDYLTLKVNGRVPSVDLLGDIVVKEQDGRTIRLSELAEVVDGVEDADTAAVWNEEPTVLLALRKQSGTNTLAVVDRVKEKMEEIAVELPPGYSLEIQRDGSAVIRTATDAVTEHLVLGALFAALIVLFFLGNFRSTIIASLAIPTSIVGTFALMKIAGYTLNSITLLALALAVGIVIDDAIVVLEGIFKHVEEDGMEPREAAIAGTAELGMAVTATTLSLIAVFLPIAFVAGIPGRFLASFGVTMSFSIAVSLFVSFTMTPMLAAHWLKKHRPGGKKPLLERITEWGYGPWHRGYAKLLAFSMRHRWAVVLLSLGALVSTAPLGKMVRKGFLPIDDRAQFEVIVRLPEGRSVAATEVVGLRVARIIRERPEVTATLLTIGDDGARTPNVARIFVKMTQPSERSITQDEFKDVVRRTILPQLPADLRVNIADVNDFGGGQATQRLQYTLSGPDLAVLSSANGRIMERLRKIPGAVDLDSTLISGKPELSVEIDRAKAADLGVQVVDIAQTLQLLVAGQKVSTYAEAGEQYEIRLRATDEYRMSAEKLGLLTVPSRKLGLVSLSDVVKLVETSSLTTINRFQRQRQISYYANPAPGADQGAIGEQIVAAVEAENLPKGYAIRPMGQTKLMKETGLSFVFGLLASMVFMYLILAAQFESWLHPVTILLSLPLTLPFAILSIILFDQALDIYSFLGIFVLFGVVKKNAILQIDHTNKLRERWAGRLTAALAAIASRDSQASIVGMFAGIIPAARIEAALATHGGEEKQGRALEGAVRLAAILKGNEDRLRPILMTTLAFVAGMIPLVTARGVGSGFSRATAGVVVGGQVMSLLLTLLAVPVAYSYFDDVQQFLGRLLRKLRGDASASAEVAK